MSFRDPLGIDAVETYLAERAGWTGDTAQIEKTFEVNYDQAIEIVAEVGKAAIELEHRPDIDIRWDRLRFAMTTHTAGDVVTELDFLLVDRIDAVATKHGATSVSG
jgi:4a-hydroxytetrahydrobiopterin dehydratase